MPFNLYTGEPIGDYGLKAYEENTEIKNEMREKADECNKKIEELDMKIELLAKYLGVEFEYGWGIVDGLKKK